MQLHAGKTTRVQSNETFNEVVKPYLNELKKYCRSLTNSKWNGEDLAQEALTKAYMSWSKKPKSISKAYLFRIASNLWIDGYRKRKPDIDFHEDLSHVATEEAPTVSDEVRAAMEILLAHLTLKQRVTVLLMEGFRYTAKETAQMLGMTEGAVKASLHRARRKLAEVDQEEPAKTEEDEVNSYVKAFCFEAAESVVQLYRNGRNEPQMSSTQKPGQNFGSIQSKGVSGSHTSYMLVSISMASGVTMYIPIYHTELNVLLSWIEELTGQSQLDIAV